ncbi:MAG: AraC family transcriptional regulator, partial [Cyanobacteria bacterium J06555_13]
MPGFKRPLEIAFGQTSLATVPDVSGTLSLKKQNNIRVVELVIEPALVIALVSDRLKTLPIPWQQPLKALASQPFYQTTKTSPKISQVLKDLLQCPYQGTLRQLYLEGKSLELIALYFADLSSSVAGKTKGLRKQDIDCLQQAQHILFENMENPPSIAAIAKQVGLSERRLQQGFRQHFGTTVFAALHDYRMAQAQLMLERGRMSVEAIAHTVSYSHRGYFAATFKRKFGSTPR